ncbi:lipase family protein, partial [Pseudomonas sp. D47]
MAQERAEQEDARFFRVEVRDFIVPEAAAHLPDADSSLGPRPQVTLKKAVNLVKEMPGIGLEPNRHHVLEVKALRAYSPLISRGKEFCALNNYH